jgi:two-component system response regulator (stage 0 sporulation protein F)
MRRRVLVIDDDEAIRKLFLLTLEETRFCVDTAASGQEGIDRTRETKYDLIYLDLKMPGINGCETLRELRKVEPDVPIYIVTAFHPEFLDQLQDLAKAGIDFELLQKPIGSKELIDVTKGILGEAQDY